MRLALMLLLAAGIASAGTPVPGTVGNGGDTILCSGAMYSLDFVLTSWPDEKRRELVPVARWEASAERLRTLIAAKLPEYLGSFDDYLGTLVQRGKRSWVGKYGLPDIHDPKIEAELPAECGALIQTVIRVAEEGRILYYYDPDAVEALRTEAPAMQYSFLMLHEWLWDLTQDPKVNLRINFLFHSWNFERLTGEELRVRIMQANR